MKKKSSVWLVCILLCVSAGMKGQKVVIENGVAITALPKSYDKNRTPYQLSVGTDYLDKDWYFLSSNIGYLQKGGRTSIPTTNNVGDMPVYTSDVAKLHYLTVNTVFNVYKMSRDGYKFFVGAGPRLDLKVGSSFSWYEEMSGSSQSPVLNPDDGLHRFVFGLKCVLGISKEFRSVDLGLNVAYLPSITNPGAYGTIYRDRTFTVGITVGLPYPKRHPDRIYSVRRNREQL